MASSSPPTDRVIQVIELLAKEPGVRMSYTEIAQRLGLSWATCHAVLTSLTAAGFLLRGEDKRFVLGPSLVAAGRAAERSIAYGPEIREMISDLSARTGKSCLLTAKSGESLVNLGGEASGASVTMGGRRVPFAAPFGVIHAAWSSRPIVERWRERGTEMGAGESDRVDQLLDEVRERGFSISPLDKDRRHLWELFELVQRGLLSDELRELIARSSGPVGRDYLWSEVTSAEALSVSSISAPIFRSPGQSVAASLHLEVLDDSVSPQQLDDLVGAVVEVAAAATAGIVAGDTARP